MAQAAYSMNLENAHRYGPEDLQQFIPSTHNRYYLDDSRLAGPYPPYLPAVVIDLLDIAGSIMWLDRYFVRPKKHGAFRQWRGWVRHFDVALGVREPDIWNASAVKTALQDLLHWLTEDTWELRFTPNPNRHPSEKQPVLWQPEPSNALVVLYSGGLDSLAGAVSLAQKYPTQNIILTSTVSSRLSGVIAKQVKELQKRFGNDHMHQACIRFHLMQQTKNYKEKTQRTRGLLFFACGVAQAVAYNASKLITCENGIGMLNLPFNKRQIGTQHTRSVHPHTLILLSRLLTQLGLGNISYEAPFTFMTKGELCSALRLANLEDLCAKTVSCDSFAIRQQITRKNPDTELHCGKCSSCLLRRQAIFSAHIQGGDMPVSYLFDVCHPGWVQHYEKDPEALLMMLDQITLLQAACNSTQPEHALCVAFPELIHAYSAIKEHPQAFGLSQEEHCIDLLTNLLQRYVKEWHMFPYYLS